MLWHRRPRPNYRRIRELELELGFREPDEEEDSKETTLTGLMKELYLGPIKAALSDS
jgi:hypothetical protein